MLELIKFQKMVESVKKNATNPHFKKTYADINSILTEIKPRLNELGLVLVQPIRDNKIYTEIWSEKGLLISGNIDLPQGLAPQQLGSAITYFRRYSLVSLLALETEIDDDGNLASSHPAPKQATKVQPAITKEIIEAMKTAIAGGRIVEVTKRLENYSLTQEQRDEIFNIK